MSKQPEVNSVAIALPMLENLEVGETHVVPLVIEKRERNPLESCASCIFNGTTICAKLECNILGDTLYRIV